MVPQYSEGAVRALLTLNRRCLYLRPQARRPLSSTCRPRDAGAPVPAIEIYNGRRQYSTTNSGQPRNIAVIGGGLTGLTTAWYLTRFMPTAKVTIYEGSGRLGGWIDTETVEVKGLKGEKGTIKFERGARMVKPYALSKWDDVAFYELVDGLNLQQQVWAKERDPNRFIYYPDHLVSLPSGTDFSPSYQPVQKIISNAAAALNMTLTEPLFKKLYPSILYALRKRKVDALRIWKDEISVGDYFLSRFGGRREVVDNVLSAMMHGVYGGDVWKLGLASNSMMTPGLRMGSFKKDDNHSPIQTHDWRLLLEIQDTPTAKIMLRCGPKKALGFREGFGTLVDALVKSLTANPNVKVVSQPVRRVQLLPNGKMEVSAKKLHSTAALYKSSHDKVISTIYSRTLFSLITFTPSLGATTAVTIRLVNLWSPHPNLNFPHNGFGYLLPQTVPLDQNPHAALGVIFDSDLKPPGSTPDTPSYGDTVPGTKITVMLGGHHWSDLPRAYLPDPYTSDSAAIAAAKETVAIQLGIPPEAWTVASTKLCKDCIPQQLVGHTKRMKKANRELLAAFDGKLAVCGGSYTAPGVPGSLRAARDVAAQVAGRMTDRNGKEMPDSVGVTGLARFEGDPMRFWGMERTDWMEGFRKEKKEEEEEW